MVNLINGIDNEIGFWDILKFAIEPTIIPDCSTGADPMKT